MSLLFTLQLLKLQINTMNGRKHILGLVPLVMLKVNLILIFVSTLRISS